MQQNPHWVHKVDPPYFLKFEWIFGCGEPTYGTKRYWRRNRNSKHKGLRFHRTGRRHRSMFLPRAYRENLGSCIAPYAPWKRCSVCGTPVKACDGKTAVCPAHPEGCELSDGRWICSEECWDVAVEYS
jgi:hypothetical protein